MFIPRFSWVRHRDTPKAFENLKEVPAFQKLSKSASKLIEPGQDDVINILRKIGSRVFKDPLEFSLFIKDLFVHANFNLDPKLYKAIENVLATPDETA